MLIVTSGDPLSVSVELLTPLLAALAKGPARDACVVIGSMWHWQDQARRLGLSLPPMQRVTSLAEALPGELAFLDIGDAATSRAAETLSPRERGVLAVRCLDRLAAEMPSLGGRGARLAVVTAPIDKHACREAGYPHPGQTEFFETLWGGPAVMTLAGGRLRVGLVTNHLALEAVPAAVTGARVESRLELFGQTLADSFGVARPRIAVCGLNPHAGDQGLFGREDVERIAPAIKAVAARRPEWTIHGPMPADTIFYRALQGSYDGVLAMYHDQGLGPLKTVHFDDAVNLSGGLAHFRASPDHGPAKDLFLAGRASPRSFAAALELASRYLGRGLR